MKQKNKTKSKWRFSYITVNENDLPSSLSLSELGCDDSLFFIYDLSACKIQSKVHLFCIRFIIDGTNLVFGRLSNRGCWGPSLFVCELSQLYTSLLSSPFHRYYTRSLAICNRVLEGVKVKTERDRVIGFCIMEVAFNFWNLSSITFQ